MSNLKPSLSLRALNFLTGSTGGGTETADAADANAAANNGSRASMKELAVETSLRDATTTRILKSTVVADSPVSPHLPQDDSALPDPPTKSGALSKSKLHASAGTLTALNDEESKGAREKESSTKKKPFSSFSSALKGLRRSFEALNRASTDDDEPKAEPAAVNKTDASPPPVSHSDPVQAEPATTAQESAQVASTSTPASASISPAHPSTLATITPQQLVAWLAESKPLFLLDTRVPDIYESIHLAGSFNVYAPPILQKRWRKNTGTGPALTTAVLAATPDARAMSAPAPGRRTSVRGVVLESLVFPETERDRFRDAFLATDQTAIVFDDTMAEHGAPGTVVWTVSNELLAQPGRTVYLLDGGLQALVRVDGVAAHLVGPAAATATAKPDAVASLAVDSAAPFQRTSSFSLRTSNLQRPKRMSLSLGLSGAAAAAATAPPVGGDAPPPSALPNGGMRRLSTGAAPIALARTSPGLATTAAAATAGAILGHTLAEEDESAVSPIHPARAAAVAAMAPQTLLSPEMDSPLETPTTPQDLEPSQILEWLWLGPDLFGHNPAAARQSLEQLRIGAILNMAAEVPPPVAHAMPMYKHFPCLDSADEKIELVLKDATAFIDQARAKNLNVYVHCKAGKSRSATAVMAYLIMHQGYSFDRAWAHVKEKRPAVAPNIGFFSVLREIGGANQDGGAVGELEIFLTPGKGEADDAQAADQAQRAHSV
ncbi:hypothetical protein GGF31_000782 [Allomyces arbusculus]|nr:hypothetical protein GGF31_000782 [Allomyces arbusculus]